MKKALISLLVVAILASGLMLTAAAANYEHIADDLNELGLFRGTDNGYELDRAPNRIEGLVMLIRLLGLEEEALACEAENPFTDVSGWQVPYVAYAYETGLTTGTTETTYGPGSLCSAQMYVTFVLRALGYSSDEDGDFTYAGAIDFGKEVGIIDDLLAAGDFLRDQMVAVSYLALLAAPKDSDFECLLEKLVADGAVAEDSAAALFAKLALIAEFAAIDSDTEETGAIAMTMKIGADMGIMGSISINMDMSMIMDDDDILAAIDMVMSMMGEEQAMQMYMVDGFVYINADGEKVKMDAGLSDMGGMLAVADVGQMTYSPLMIAEISKASEGDYTVYTVKIASGVLDDVMGQATGMMGAVGLGDMGLGDMDMSLSISEMKFYTDADGSLKKVAMAMDISMALDIGGVTMPISMKMNIEVEITAVGDDVKVELPDDLDDYEEMDLEAALEDTLADTAHSDAA